MGRRSRHPAAPPGAPSHTVHGPSGPPTSVLGVERLRRAMNVSAGVDVDRLCEEAAAELEDLRATRHLRVSDPTFDV